MGPRAWKTAPALWSTSIIGQACTRVPTTPRTSSTQSRTSAQRVPPGTGVEPLQSFVLGSFGSGNQEGRQYPWDAGGIDRSDSGEQILREGKADLVGINRRFFADPDWANKVQAGRDHSLRFFLWPVGPKVLEISPSFGCPSERALLSLVGQSRAVS